MCNGLREPCADLVQQKLIDDVNFTNARAARVLTAHRLGAPVEKVLALELAQMAMNNIARTCRSGCALRRAQENTEECCNHIERKNEA